LRSRRLVKVRLKGWTVYILECADGTYSTGMCRSLRKRIAEINIFSMGYQFMWHPERLPVKVVYKEIGLPFKEAFSKARYLKCMGRAPRKKIIETGVWTIGGALKEYARTNKAGFKYKNSRSIKTPDLTK